MKRLLFHFVDLTVLNSNFIHKSPGQNVTPLKFGEQLVGDLNAVSHIENTEVRGVEVTLTESEHQQISRRQSV
jgi:hypothetical protein